jgi:hypothetical protein
MLIRDIAGALCSIGRVVRTSAPAERQGCRAIRDEASVHGAVMVQPPRGRGPLGRGPTGPAPTGVSTMTAMPRRTTKAAAPIIPAALLAGLGLPALGALIFLAILVIMTACWVIDDADRTEQVCRILLAGRGNTNCLPLPAGSSLPRDPSLTAGPCGGAGEWTGHGHNADAPADRPDPGAEGSGSDMMAETERRPHVSGARRSTGLRRRDG